MTAPVDKPSPGSLRQSLLRRWQLVVRGALLLLTLVLIADAVVGEKGLLTLLTARRTFTAVEQALQRAREENDRLRERARRLREDPAAIEEVARGELGLLKPGEKLFIIKDVPPRQ